MKRRSFLKSVAALFLTPVVAPVTTGASIEAKPTKRKRIFNKDRIGLYSYQVQGCAVMDNRRILLANFD